LGTHYGPNGINIENEFRIISNAIVTTKK